MDVVVVGRVGVFAADELSVFQVDCIVETGTDDVGPFLAAVALHPLDFLSVREVVWTNFETLLADGIFLVLDLWIDLHSVLNLWVSIIQPKHITLSIYDLLASYNHVISVVHPALFVLPSLLAFLDVQILESYVHPLAANILLSASLVALRR